MRSVIAGLAAAVSALVIAGCGPGNPETAPVHGTVTLNGQPLAAGEVWFYAETGETAVGRIRPDGTYRLTTFQPEDGAVPGQHEVAVRELRSHGPSGQPPAAPIPHRYRNPDTSGLVFVVRPEFNTIDIPLTTEEDLAGRATRIED